MKKRKPSGSKYDIVQNIYTLQQIKKMTGKKLIISHSSVSVSVQIKNRAKFIKSEMLKSEAKSDKSLPKKVMITTMCSDGILHVFKNMEVFLAINTISYKELSEIQNDIIVCVIQYPKLTKTEVKELLEKP
jgi:hypothetical protein